MPQRKPPNRKDGRYEYKITTGRKLDGTPERKSFYSTKSLLDAKRQAEEYKLSQGISDATGIPLTPKNIKFKEISEKYLEIK